MGETAGIGVPRVEGWDTQSVGCPATSQKEEVYSPLPSFSLHPAMGLSQEGTDL